MSLPKDHSPTETLYENDLDEPQDIDLKEQ